jgi:excisionase family DNA binding protein
MEGPTRPGPATLAGRLLSVDEAAGHLGMSRWTFRHWIADGRVPVVRLGRPRLRGDEPRVDTEERPIEVEAPLNQRSRI